MSQLLASIIRFASASLLAAGLLLLAGCDAGDAGDAGSAGGSVDVPDVPPVDPPPVDPPPVDPPPVETGPFPFITADVATRIELARVWLDRPDLQPHSALLMAMFQRLYDVPLEKVDPVALFDKHVADYVALGYTDYAEGTRLFRRMFDGAAVANAYYLSQATGVDRLTLIGLYCDTVAPPTGFREDLLAASQVGGYDTTHALLAVLLLRSNGCDGFVSAGDIALIEERNAAVINLDDLLFEDLDVEAMALSAAAGRLDLVPIAAHQSLLGAQQASGGWGRLTWLNDGSTVAPVQHTTALAFWYLHAVQAADGFVPLIPPTQ